MIQQIKPQCNSGSGVSAKATETLTCMMCLRISSHNSMGVLHCLAFVTLNEALQVILTWELLENIIARNKHGSTLLSKTKQSCPPLISQYISSITSFGTMTFERKEKLREHTETPKNSYWNIIANVAFFPPAEKWKGICYSWITHTHPKQLNRNWTPHTQTRCTHTQGSLWCISAKLSFEEKEIKFYWTTIRSVKIVWNAKVTSRNRQISKWALSHRYPPSRGTTKMANRLPISDEPTKSPIG